MTNEEKKELGMVLERNNVKAIFYEEITKKGGAYHILYTDEKGNIQETAIFGKHLE